MKALLCLFAFVWSVLAVLLLLLATQHICAQPFTLEDEVMLKPKAAASAPAAWAPTNAYAWYHADGTNLSDGTKLNFWADSAGNGKTLWAYANNPTTYSPYYSNSVVELNSKPAVIWAGAQAMTNVFGSTLSPPWTIIVVMDMQHAGNQYFCDGISISPRMVFQQAVTTGFGQTYNGTAFAGGSLSIANLPRVWTLFFNGSASYIRTNGVLYAPPGTDIGSAGANGLTIGARYDLTGGLAMFASVAEIILRNASMATNDLCWDEKNLCTKYGLPYSGP